MNVWIRDRKTCSVASSVTGKVIITQCCGKEIRLEDPRITGGHGEFTVPPGCYIVRAILDGSPKTAWYETMVILPCDRTACVNFIYIPSLT